MIKSKHGQVPHDFKMFYEPILQVKYHLTSKDREKSIEKMIPGFMMLYFACFVMNHLYKQSGKDNSRALCMREHIEKIMSKEGCLLDQALHSKIVSFIDNIAKELNLTFKAYIHIGFYQAYLDFEIYRKFHPDLEIFDFAAYNYIQADTIAAMKKYYALAIAILEKLNLPIDKQTEVSKIKSALSASK